MPSLIPEPGTPGLARIHCFASGERGVHALTREAATEAIRTPSPGVIVWIDVVRPGQAEGEFLKEKLGFHPLAVEDCLRGRQRPKLERYQNHLFLVIYTAQVRGEGSRIEFNELHVFLGKNFIVTVHDDRIEEVPETLARWRSAPHESSEVGILAYRLLDAVVDDYFPVVAHFTEATASLEEGIFEADEESLQAILAQRREMVLAKRMIAPTRDIVTLLLRKEQTFMSPELAPYLQDLKDHTMRVTEEIDMIRELLSTSLDAQLSLASNQLNRTMRTMASWSIILMSVTLIAGVYGMNFTNMPELEWQWGYPGALLGMGLVGLSLITLFRKKDWL